MARPAGAALPGDRAVSSGLRQLGAARLARHASTTSPISISISPPTLGLEDAVLVGACFGGWIAAEMAVRSTARVLAPGAGRSARHQGRRPRRARHRRHARHAARRVSAARLGRSGEGRASTSRSCRRRELAAHRARPRGVRALRLEALHAQPAAEALAASHRRPDAAAVGRAGRHRHARPMARAGAQEIPGARTGGHPRRRPLPALGAAARLRRAARRLSSTPQRRPEEHAMRVWYFSEMAYHPAWEAGLKRGSLRVVLPNSNFDPQVGARPAQPLSRRVRAVRRGRARHHGQRAPQHRDLHDRLGADGAGDHRARNQARAAAVARHADRQPARSGARRRGDGVARRAVGRAAGDGARQGRALRDRAGQQQPGRPDAPLLGSARPDPEGDVDAPTARSTGRASSSTTATSTSGRGRCSSRRRRSG